MDVARKITVTYAMNKMEQGTLGNDRTRAYVNEIYKVLGEASVGTATTAVV